jgi:predicted transcriptional regulator
VGGPLRRDLKKLISGGFVEEAESQAGYKLTAKGAEFLGKRGAGLNEA